VILRYEGVIEFFTVELSEMQKPDRFRPAS
jgi:hypothetical protein